MVDHLVAKRCGVPIEWMVCFWLSWLKEVMDSLATLGFHPSCRAFVCFCFGHPFPHSSVALHMFWLASNSWGTVWQQAPMSCCSPLHLTSKKQLPLLIHPFVGQLLHLVPSLTGSLYTLLSALSYFHLLSDSHTRVTALSFFAFHLVKLLLCVSILVSVSTTHSFVNVLKFCQFLLFLLLFKLLLVLSFMWSAFLFYRCECLYACFHFSSSTIVWGKRPESLGA